MGNCSSIKLELSDTPLIMNIGILNIWFFFIYLVIDGIHTVYVNTALVNLRLLSPYALLYFNIFNSCTVVKCRGDTWWNWLQCLFRNSRVWQILKITLNISMVSTLQSPEQCSKRLPLSVKASSYSFAALQNCVPFEWKS